MFHPVNLRRVEEALHVLAQAEDGGAAPRLVAAYALEDGRAVVEDVRHDGDARVVPRDELAVVPDLLHDGRRLHVLLPHVVVEHILSCSFRPGYTAAHDFRGCLCGARREAELKVGSYLPYCLDCRWLNYSGEPRYLLP